MEEKIRITRGIHEFVKGRMEWEEAANLIEEIAKSEEWIDHLLMKMMLYELGESPICQSEVVIVV